MQPAENFSTKTRVVNSWLEIVTSDPYPSIAVVITVSCSKLGPQSSTEIRSTRAREKNKTGTTAGLRQPLINDTGWYSIKIITFHQNNHLSQCSQRTGERKKWWIKKKKKKPVKGRNLQPPSDGFLLHTL